MTEILSKDFLKNIKDKIQNVKNTNEAEMSIKIPSLTPSNNGNFLIWELFPDGSSESPSAIGTLAIVSSPEIGSSKSNERLFKMGS